MSNNISRARTSIFDYAMCNEFEYFITLTLNKELKDRYDIKGYIKNLGQFIRDYRKKTKCNIQYLLIPERHKDGAWHMHGLIKGIDPNSLREFKLDELLPNRVLDLIISGRVIYDIPEYRMKFGYVTCEKILDPNAAAKYITKYITKSINNNKGIIEKNQKMYYCSKGLNKPVTIKKGYLRDSLNEIIKYDYENEYIKQVILNDTQAHEYFNLDLD